MHSRYIVFCLLIGATASSADPLQDRCLLCHGSNLQHSDNSGPELGGFSRKYIQQQLMSFKNGQRGEDTATGRIMAAEVKQLTYDQIKGVSRWAATLPHEQKLNFKQQMYSSTATVFEEQCKGCHVSFIGRHITGSPRLDDLEPDYINRQLDSFKANERNLQNPSKHATKMKAVAASLTNSQLSSLQAYFSNIKR